MTPALVNKLKPHNQAFIDEQPLVFSKLKFRVLLAIFLTTCILGIVFGKLETLRQSFWLVAQPYVGKRKYFFWLSTPFSSGTISYKIFSPLQKIFGKFPLELVIGQIPLEIYPAHVWAQHVEHLGIFKNVM